MWPVRNAIWMHALLRICSLLRRIVFHVTLKLTSTMDASEKTVPTATHPKAGSLPSLITTLQTSNWQVSTRKLPARSAIMKAPIEVRQKIVTPAMQIKMSTMENMDKIVNSAIPQLIGMMRVLTTIRLRSNWKAAMQKSSARLVI